MDREEIVSDIMRKLEFHITSTAHMSQEPYRRDMFSVFKEAYKNGLCDDSNPDQLTGDVLTRLAVDRLGESVENPRFDDQVERFSISWNEWKYAFDNY